MSGFQAQHALIESESEQGRRRLRRMATVVGEVMLWTLGIAGVISLIAALSAKVWGLSIVLFATGSMDPTIPAGSAALIRWVPASSLQEGDIATVVRPGELPITHRITSIEVAGGASSPTRLITMRGDANSDDDPEPYVITQAGLVLASAPNLAAVVAGLRQPLAMVAMSVAAAMSVCWACWPHHRAKVMAVARRVVQVR